MKAINILGKSKTQAIPKQRGIGMIEVLVTLFILSVGLLGVASLQFIGSFSNADALNRTQAVFIAQQFGERLSANAIPSDITDGFVVDNAYFDEDLYNFANLSCTGGGLPYDCYCKAHPATVPNCQTGDCTSAQLAEFDAYQMSCATVMTNPNAEISLRCSEDKDLGDTDLCTAGSIHEVIISWPAKTWQNNSKVKNASCNASSGDDNDCVVVEVAL